MCRISRFLNLICCYLGLSGVICDYLSDRRELIKTLKSSAIGSEIILDHEEENVNDMLMRCKNEEFSLGRLDRRLFLSGRHFFTVKGAIEKSPVFKIIKKIPKGASLHVHGDAMVSDSFYFYNLTFRPNLHVALNSKGKLVLKFLNRRKGPFIRVDQIRRWDPTFNFKLKNQMTLTHLNPHDENLHIDRVWEKFEDIFDTVDPLLEREPIFKDYFYESLKELYEDNVKYLEFRGGLSKLCDERGQKLRPEDTVRAIMDVVQDFKTKYPDFIGVKNIFTVYRRSSNGELRKKIDIFKRLQREFPDFIAGFDMVGQEDKGRPLIDFIPELLELQKEGTKFFFHAGETNWFGESSDLNLFDAVLLNTSRIGHGYAIVKHPELQRLVKEKDIAIEIAPISNQVLKLVEDLRNHPGNYLIANGFPVVITCDDPSFWGAKGLSYDWYMAFMAMSSKQSDLRLLKQLAINSIKYSAMSNEQKDSAMRAWETDWNMFIQDMLRNEVFCLGSK